MLNTSVLRLSFKKIAEIDDLRFLSFHAGSSIVMTPEAYYDHRGLFQNKAGYTAIQSRTVGQEQ